MSSGPSSLHTLYRFYAADDALLYVGITRNPGRRLEKHSGTKAWWAEVARIGMEQHVDHAELVAAERAAIQDEKPRYNVRMNGDSRSSHHPRAEKRASDEEPPDGLVGRWFHSYVPVPEGKDTTYAELDGNGNMREWQGQIVDRDGDLFVAQLYSWWDGCATNEVLVDAAAMRLWRFYSSNEAMHCGGGCPESIEGGRCRAPVTHLIRSGYLGPIYRCSDCITFYAGKAQEL